MVDLETEAVELAEAMLEEVGPGLSKIGLLIQWMDLLDAQKGWTDKSVQKDLRRWQQLALRIVSDAAGRHRPMI